MLIELPLSAWAGEREGGVGGARLFGGVDVGVRQRGAFDDFGSEEFVGVGAHESDTGTWSLAQRDQGVAGGALLVGAQPQLVAGPLASRFRGKAVQGAFGVNPVEVVEDEVAFSRRGAVGKCVGARSKDWGRRGRVVHPLQVNGVAVSESLLLSVQRVGARGQHCAALHDSLHLLLLDLLQRGNAAGGNGVICRLCLLDSGVRVRRENGHVVKRE